MKTVAKIKLYSPVVLALVSLCLSIVLIVVTFSLVYWLNVIQTGDNYGMWQGCLRGGDVCGTWYNIGQTLLNYTMTGKQLIETNNLFYKGENLKFGLT